MSFPFGNHPTLYAYIGWLRDQHAGTAQSGVTNRGGQTVPKTRLSLPSGRSVAVIGIAQTEHLTAWMVGYIDRRLGVTSPWASIYP